MNGDDVLLNYNQAGGAANCQFTDDDEDFVGKVIQLLEDGALPKRTTQKIAEALQKEIQPLNVLRILRRGIPREFLLAAPMHASQARAPREVILSSWIVGGG